jgi:hypothetical protein
LLGVTLEDYVVVAVKSTLLPGVSIGKGSFVAAHSLVGQDMPEDSLVSGSPAKRLCKASDMRLKGDIRVRAYPWQKRFVRGYPDSIIEKWATGIEPVDLYNTIYQSEPAICRLTEQLSCQISSIVVAT